MEAGKYRSFLMDPRNGNVKANMIKEGQSEREKALPVMTVV